MANAPPAQNPFVALRDHIDNRFDQLDGRIDHLDGRITQVNNNLTERIDQIDQNMTVRIMASTNNNVARIHNSTLRGSRQILHPLLHPRTNDAIPNFPYTIGELEQLDLPEINDILTILDYPKQETLSSGIQNLKYAIGVLMS